MGPDFESNISAENSNSTELTDPTAVDTTNLNSEALALINKIIAENDTEKQKDLTYLFNANQNKKTMVRVNKLSELLDTITSQALARFTERPDEISNKELIDSMKVVQDLIERGTNQASGNNENVPFIQINQQTNEVNLNDEKKTLNRDSREKVKNAVLSLLDGIKEPESAQDVIEITQSEEQTDD